MVYAKKEDDYYWMHFMKTLPKSFVEGYKEVCEILAGKSLKEVEEEEEGDAVNHPTKNVFVEHESTTTSSCCDGRKPPQTVRADQPHPSEQKGDKHTTVCS